MIVEEVTDLMLNGKEINEHRLAASLSSCITQLVKLGETRPLDNT